MPQCINALNRIVFEVSHHLIDYQFKKKKNSCIHFEIHFHFVRRLKFFFFSIFVPSSIQMQFKSKRFYFASVYVGTKSKSLKCSTQKRSFRYS